MIQDAPWIGHGPEGIAIPIPIENGLQASELLQASHNEYLEIAADYGWLGFSLFAVAWLSTLLRLGYLTRTAREARHRWMGYAALAISGTMVHSFLIFATYFAIR